MHLHALLRGAALAAAVCLAGATAQAQVILTGNVFDGSGGPLLPGVVYHATNFLTVPGGQTLTVSPGAIVKFDNNLHLNVFGTLTVNGTALSPAIFTSIQDDSVGGDTGGNGASSGSPGDWRGILFNGGSDASVLDHAVVRYGGASGYANVYVQGASVTLENSTFSNGSTPGANFTNSVQLPTVQNCAFDNNSGVAVAALRLDAVPGFSNNTATGNAAGNYMQLSTCDPTADRVIGPQNCLNGALVFTNFCTIPGGITLTLQSGVVIKFTNNLHVNTFGTLLAQGTSPSPVVLTSFGDDTVAGDTNNDGPSSGLPGDWRGVLFNGGSDASILDHTVVRYGGASGYADVYVQGANVTLTNSTFSDCSTQGINFTNSVQFPTVSHCAVDGNASVAMFGVRLDAVPGFTSNTASGNAGGNFMQITTADPTADRTIVPANCLNGALVFTNFCTIPTGVTLTLEAGVVIKFTNNLHVNTFGTLLAHGTAPSPVVFTSYADDAYAGDTNNDGASSGSPGDWRGLLFNAGADASVIDHSVVRYCGASGYSGAYVQGASVTFTNSTFAYCSTYGVNFTNSVQLPTVSHCAFDGNTSVAVFGLRIDSVPGFSDNTATANGGGNFMQITTADPTANRTIAPENCLNGALVFTNFCTIPSGVTLTLQPGVVIKFTNNLHVNVFGSFDVLGSLASPVTLTSYADDSVAGDTNFDGSASLPAPGDWRGVIYNNSAEAATLQSAVIRYTGASGFPGLTLSSPAVTAKDVRVDHSSTQGFQASALAVEPVNWIAFHCATGIEMTAGALDIRHATVASCTGKGIRRIGSYTGIVRDSIAWNNAGGNFDGVATGQVIYSDGSAFAGSGNIDTDPMFMDLPQGDLHLAAGSPCIDTADPMSPADPDGTRADMGAYHFDHCVPIVYCTGKTNSKGCVPFLTYSGYASATSPSPFYLSANQVINNKSGIYFYSLAGPANTPFQGGTLCVHMPLHGRPAVTSHGNAPPNDCSGVLTFDFNAYIRNGNDPSLVSGVGVCAQAWYRDPPDLAGFGTGLSNAIQFRICP